MKLSEMEYSLFMNTIYDYCKENHKGLKCKNCGGLGFVPLFCCNGMECGCQGRPIDFETKCKRCGRKAPEEL